MRDKIKRNLAWFFVIFLLGILAFLSHNFVSGQTGEESFLSAILFLSFFACLLADFVLVIVLIVQAIKIRKEPKV